MVLEFLKKKKPLHKNPWKLVPQKYSFSHPQHRFYFEGQYYQKFMIQLKINFKFWKFKANCNKIFWLFKYMEHSLLLLFWNENLKKSYDFEIQIKQSKF